MKHKILITGASKGFGYLTAKTLLNKGHLVAASMRNIETTNQQAALELSALGAKIIEMDITSTPSIERGVAMSIDELDGLDVVINNAGIGALGVQEQFTIDDFKHIFDVNVFGVQSVIRTVLPHFRKQKNGLLLFMSSVLGRITLPFQGPYNASKWALEALAESYKMELTQFGIDSCIVEPGGYLTPFMNQLMPPSGISNAPIYKIANAPELMHQNLMNGISKTPDQIPQNVANAILAIIETPKNKRPTRTVVDRTGLNALLTPYNHQLEEIQAQLLGDLSTNKLLQPKLG